MTDFERDLFARLDKLVIGQYGKIELDDKDRESKIEAIKKYIDLWGNLEFNSEFTRFRKIMTFDEVEETFEREFIKQKHDAENFKRRLNNGKNLQ